MGNNHDGILLIDKNEGETSFDIVKRIRQNSMVKKAGHAGTLDPFATGLLIVLLGQGTKLTPYFMESEKIYRAIMRLGIETDTQDPTGQVLHSRPVPDFTQGYIKEKAKNFIGEIEQTPPAFSALNYKGKRAYEFARKGIRIDLEKRRVKIHSIEIISINLPDITMEIRCSKGTYIRTLAADMGKRLGPGAHLKALTRLAIGSFRVEDALDSMDTAFSPLDSLIQSEMITLRKALPHMKEILVDDRMAKKIRNGYQPVWDEGVAGSDFYEGYMKLVNMRELVAIIKVRHLSGDDEGWLKIMRVFN